MRLMSLDRVTKIIWLTCFSYYKEVRQSNEDVTKQAEKERLAKAEWAQEWQRINAKDEWWVYNEFYRICIVFLDPRDN